MPIVTYVASSARLATRVATGSVVSRADCAARARSKLVKSIDVNDAMPAGYRGVLGVTDSS